MRSYDEPIYRVDVWELGDPHTYLPGDFTIPWEFPRNTYPPVYPGAISAPPSSFPWGLLLLLGAGALLLLGKRGGS